MAWNIPLLFQTYNWDAERGCFSMKPNTEFISLVKTVFQLGDTILVTCRSGGRSAMAVNRLAEAGFKNVYNITDGFEGDLVKDEKSLYYEKRMMNGWKNSGAPWTYNLDPKLILIPDDN
jgi:rhodanese-related sulfurtransferase